MHIPVKFKVGERVFFMLQDKVESREIVGVVIEVVQSIHHDDKLTILYQFQNLNAVGEYRVYKSKRALLKSL